MSKVFNMVGGGGKNISSIIITGLESTDTVTCTKNGKTYTATWDSTAQHWEIVGLPLGTFAVSATNGTRTITETVLIDIAGVYEVEMDYNLWLYKDGNQYEDATGGWQCWKLAGTSELLDTSIHIASSENNQWQATSTKTKINLTNFSNAKAEVKIESQMMAQYCGLGLRICSDVNTSTSTDPYLVRKEAVSDIGTHIITVDISDLNGEYYIALEGYYVGSAYIYKVWLE